MINESIWDKVDLIEKRFENRLDKSNVKFNTINPVWDNEKENALNVFEMIDELNYLNDCCYNLIDDNTEYVAEINQIHRENKQLKKEKERYKRLSEIRQQEINNRILTIQDFINNCSDNKVRSVLKELFYSEVNEYDLSLENRKLFNENGRLKKENKLLYEKIDFLRVFIEKQGFKVNLDSDVND